MYVCMIKPVIIDLRKCHTFDELKAIFSNSKVQIVNLSHSLQGGFAFIANMYVFHG